MTCSRAIELLDAYCAALSAFHGARLHSQQTDATDPEFPAAKAAKDEAFAQAYKARVRYRAHVLVHGCRVLIEASESRSRMEQRLRNEMKDARQRFLAASNGCDRLIGIALDSPGTADGNLALEQAKALRGAAFRSYDEALRRYADFITGEK